MSAIFRRKSKSPAELLAKLQKVRRLIAAGYSTRVSCDRSATSHATWKKYRHLVEPAKP